MHASSNCMQHHADPMEPQMHASGNCIAKFLQNKQPLLQHRHHCTRPVHATSQIDTQSTDSSTETWAQEAAENELQLLGHDDANHKHAC